MDGRACSIEPNGERPSAAGFVLTVRNATEHDAGFDLYRLYDDTTFEDWVEYNRIAEEELVAGNPGPGDPRGIADPVDLMEAVPAGSDGSVVATPGTPGSYALQCWEFDGNAVLALKSAGPIVVNP
jgi:hypothetical protein